MRQKASSGAKKKKKLGYTSPNNLFTITIFCGDPKFAKRRVGLKSGKKRGTEELEDEKLSTKATKIGSLLQMFYNIHHGYQRTPLQ